ncbi:MAG TPA: methionyl-tRNA formyltransferase [Clostridiales bacterium]|nr:methionyl-tRNA formyltransferase [Clostridiales bacterium]
MKIVFFGTPDFSIPTLQKLIDSHHEVIGVVTQPDRPVGRNGRIVFSPVKQLALKYNIPVYQYEKIRRDGVEELVGLKADLFVTAAYGQILSKEILDASTYGVFNVHGSLLPKYRGAAPIQWAVINGEKTTGITILRSDVGMDDGDIILKHEVDIMPEETAGELFDRLAVIGADCLMEALQQLEDGTITYTPQDHSLATVCKMLKKENCTLNFDNSAYLVKQFILGLNPWPVAEMKLEEGRFKVYKAIVYNNNDLMVDNYKTGEVVLASPKSGLVIKANDGFVEITEIQAENGKVMNAKSLLNGKHIRVGQIVNE